MALYPKNVSCIFSKDKVVLLVTMIFFQFAHSVLLSVLGFLALFFFFFCSIGSIKIGTTQAILNNNYFRTSMLT